MTLNEALDQLADDAPLPSAHRPWRLLLAFGVIAPAALVAVWWGLSGAPSAVVDADFDGAPPATHARAVLRLVVEAPRSPAPYDVPLPSDEGPTSADALATATARVEVAPMVAPAPVAHHPTSALGRADALVAAGRWKAAAWWYQQASAQQKSVRAEALAGWALCLYELKQTKAAQKMAQRALRLDADQELATVLLGFVAQMKGDVVTARERYQRYVTAHPTGAWVSELERVVATLDLGPGAPVVSSSVASR